MNESHRGSEYRLQRRQFLASLLFGGALTLTGLRAAEAQGNSPKSPQDGSTPPDSNPPSKPPPPPGDLPITPQPPTAGLPRLPEGVNPPPQDGRFVQPLPPPSAAPSKEVPTSRPEGK